MDIVAHQFATLPAQPTLADIFTLDEGGLWEGAVATMLCIFDALMHTARRISYANRAVRTAPSESINDTHPRTSARTQAPESSAPLIVCRTGEQKCRCLADYMN